MTDFKKITLKTARVLSVALLASTGFSQSFAVRINQIDIKGNKRIENETILSYLMLQKGDESTELTRDEALKRLYQTGLFADIKISQHQGALVVDVVENSLINRIFFEGNKKLKDDKLQAELQLRPREVLSRTKVQAAQQRILDLYRQMGRFNAVVLPKIVRLPQDRVDLIFEITEGDVTYVRKINFIGNKNFASEDLRAILLTKPYRWYRFFASDDVFEAQRFEADQQLLRQYYYDNGYPDFRIISGVAELSVDRKDFYITITLDEGQKYNFGKVRIDSNIKGVKGDDLLKKLKIQKGDVFSNKAILEASETLTQALGEKGFAFANVIPDYTKNVKDQTVDLSFTLNESGKVSVERIEIKGNDRTRDYVIRREIGIHEGDVYNSTAIQKAENKLRETGYFKNVSIDIEAGSADDKAKLIVTVEEQSTGELAFSAGYSTFDKMLAKVSFTENNFMGKGLAFHSEAEVAQRRQNYEIGLTDPHFMGRDLRVGGKIFHQRYRAVEGLKSSKDKNDPNKNKDELTDGYSSKSTGFLAFMGYDLTEHLSQTFLYTFKTEMVNNRHTDDAQARTRFNADYLKYLDSQSKRDLYSAITHVLAYDRRNSIFNPSSGFLLSMTNTYAGVGGSVKFFRNSAKGSVYYSPFKNLTLNFKIEGGDIRGIGKDLRFSDLFTLGGESFPGFEDSGLGYRETSTGNSLRGRRFWTAKLQANFPIPGVPDEFSVKGGVFVMAGNLTNPSFIPTEIINGQKVPVNFKKEAAPYSNKPRVSAGVQLNLRLPFAPLKLIYAKPLRKEAHDEEHRFLITVSTANDD